MTRAARYLDRLYREHPGLWKKEKAKAEQSGFSMLFLVESKANHWALMLKSHGPLKEIL